jgi:Uncharacterised protein family (UPF0158)
MTFKRPIAQVEFSELLDAFEFDSLGEDFDHHSYINADTGAVFWVSPDHDWDDEVPDDFETSDRYIPVPHKRDLGLGRGLALSFAEEELPDHYGPVDGFFRKKGAYRRFKDFLDARGLLERWYDFEQRSTEEALRSWCRENGIPLKGN